jgi:hypothetical protein
MSLNESRLKIAIKTELMKIPSANDNDGTLSKVSEAIAKAVVEEIKNNLEIKIPITTVITIVSPPAVGILNIVPIPCTVL